MTVTLLDQPKSVTDYPVAEEIMEALARYRYLTKNQLLMVNGRDDKTLRDRLGGLVNGNFVKKREFRLGQGVGRLPNIYWLSALGGKWVKKAMGVEVKPPDGDEIKTSHVPHRILTVDCLIAADAWARRTGQSVPEFKTYMHFENRRVSTLLPLVGKTAAPDIIFELEDTAENRRVYVLEVYCDGADNSINHPLKQLEPLVLAGHGRTLNDNLNIGENDKAAGILVVCDTLKMRDRLLLKLPLRAGMPPLEKRIWNRILFKSADELVDFGNGWQKVDGSSVNLPA